jgi:aromatic-L-amino-acid/L-tryptophan decarboxylase
MVNHLITGLFNRFKIYNMDKETFRQYGHEFIDWIADYLENAGKYPVRSTVNPGDIKSQLPLDPPGEGESMAAIWKDFQNIIMPGITHWQHPRFFAYFPANNSPASVLAELLTAGIGAQCMIWETSPAAAELEEVVMQWLRKMLGLPEGLTGVIQDTASTATLCALLTAREVATGFSFNEKGAAGKLRVYASREAHSSIEKGAVIAGYGRENLCFIPTGDNYAMRADLLEEAISNDIKAGFKPACVIATIGTTSSTAIDPLPEIGHVCKKYGVWLHVDAAFAGAAAMLEENSELLSGSEYIDSFVFNPHKWLFTNFDCSAYFIRNPEYLIRTLSVNPEYLKTGKDSQVNNYRDWGIQLGRRFRALKLWFVIREFGVNGLKKIIREHIRLARYFAGLVESSDEFELLAPVNTNLVCFRWNDGSRGEPDLNKFNQALLQKINESGKVYMTHTSLSGRYTIRMAIGQRTTAQEDVERAWIIINDALKSMPGTC